MSSRKRGRGPVGAGEPRESAAGGTRRPGRVLPLASIVAMVLGAVLGWWSLRGSRQRPNAGAVATVVPVPLDSVAAVAQLYEAATSRGDWPEALRLQQRIAAALPTNPIALRQLGQSLHNHRNAITLPDGRTRWLLRNSLVRAGWEARALALFDSSAAVSGTPADLALAHYWKGRTAVYEGLPLDALVEFEAALAIAPSDTGLRRVRDQQREELRGVQPSRFRGR